MQDVSFTDQDYRLWVLLHQTRDAVHIARKKELGRFEISTIQAAALFIIQAIGEQATPAEISRWLFRKPHSVSGLLNRMEKEGLVKKTKDLDKKNLVRVTLTEKGRQAYNHSLKRPPNLFDSTTTTAFLAFRVKMKLRYLHSYLFLLQYKDKIRGFSTGNFVGYRAQEAKKFTEIKALDFFLFAHYTIDFIL